MSVFKTEAAPAAKPAPDYASPTRRSNRRPRPSPARCAACLKRIRDDLDRPAGRPGVASAFQARGAASGRRRRGSQATAGLEQLKKAQAVAEIVREQSDYYHATKTTIFNALMNTIDLAQLAHLDQKAASEEIRDIVSELVAIKNVSMSVAEQEHLVQDIVNDVLGYGPLEPLLRAATTSPTSWSMARGGSSSKSRARSS